MGQEQRGIRGTVDGHALVHGGNLFGWLEPSHTRPALEDQAHPEPKGKPCSRLMRVAASACRRLLPVPPVLMEHRQQANV